MRQSRKRCYRKEVMSRSDKAETFGHRLRYLRTLFAITQEEVAGLTGIFQGNLTKVENNTYIPDVRVIERVAECFHTTLEYLRYGEGPLFTNKLAICDLAPSDRRTRRKALLRGGNDFIPLGSHLVKVDRLRRCLYTVGRRPIYVISYNRHPIYHVIIRTESLIFIDDPYGGVKFDALPDEMADSLSKLFTYWDVRYADDPESAISGLGALIDDNLKSLFGPFTGDDIVSRAVILSRMPKSKLILDFCRKIRAKEADLAQALKDYQP